MIISDLDLNSLTINPYWDRTHEGKDREQISWHHDCLHESKKPHTFCHSKNSQAEGTPSCILSLGETRTLKFRCCRDRNRTNPPGGKGPIPISNSIVQFDLTHGSLLILHPHDEKTAMRAFFHKTKYTFHQHGAVMFGSAGLSAALVFRAVTHSKDVFKNSGLAVPTRIPNLIQQIMKTSQGTQKHLDLAEKIEKEKNEVEKGIRL